MGVRSVVSQVSCYWPTERLGTGRGAGHPCFGSGANHGQVIISSPANGCRTIREARSAGRRSRCPSRIRSRGAVYWRWGCRPGWPAEGCGGGRAAYRRGARARGPIVASGPARPAGVIHHRGGYRDPESRPSSRAGSPSPRGTRGMEERYETLDPGLRRHQRLPRASP